MNFLSKFSFLLLKPRVIIVGGEGMALASEAIFQVLKQYFKVRKISKDSLLIMKRRNELLIFETNSASDILLKFAIEKSSLPILIITHTGVIPTQGDSFCGEKEKIVQMKNLAKLLPLQGHLILNFDDEAVREIKLESRVSSLTFGFQQGADFQVTDIKENGRDTRLLAEGESPALGTNFKINHKGNIVPIWLEKLFGKEYLYGAQAAICAGMILNLNLVQISQALKFYQPSSLGKVN